MTDHGAGLLKVTVVKATGLPAQSGAFDKTDPFVKLVLVTDDDVEGESVMTAVKDNAGSDPVWNETFTMNKKEEEDILEVRIYDDDTLANDFLCSRQIDLDEVKTGAPKKSRKKPLRGHSKIPAKEADDSTCYTMVREGKEVGKIYLKIEFDI
eukprot:CAMPEP_0173381738 /NCGR_PEP_ID=MMETSP1356-20130122/4148_1 /TAXON_ID=77927 ORGANISM="Hemiselmis virescens, Strain PCC157" /NCGR_SAMPLE_ID=MMETSP1356 /ASSEMBLY_ACC=CAM_ASM_000847 /LENGTH=152 /DNA_ID=CAMNT_0014335709 /DNA_START=27 /DNA_END=485 /DNA_ORIENTATION=-